MKLGQLVFPYSIHASVEICLLALSVRSGSSPVPRAPCLPARKGSLPSTGRAAHCSTASALLLMLPATPPSSHRESSSQSRQEIKYTPGRWPLPASLVYTFQTCTWLHVRAADTTVTSPCTRAEALLSSQLLALNMTFFRVHRKDSTKSSKLFGFEKTTEMKSLTIIKMCFRNWGQVKVVFLLL